MLLQVFLHSYEFIFNDIVSIISLIIMKEPSQEKRNQKNSLEVKPKGLGSKEKERIKQEIGMDEKMKKQASERMIRLSHHNYILGENDLLLIQKITTSAGFLKKVIIQQQRSFISGLIFPSTAHFSTFISSKIRLQQANCSVKACLFVFDIFKQKDIHIEVNIPGSLAVRTYQINGTQIVHTSQDYLRGYYSAFFRSLYPSYRNNFHSYPYSLIYESVVQMLPHLIPYLINNPIQISSMPKVNFLLQLLLTYCLQNKFEQLYEMVVGELKRRNVQNMLGYILRGRMCAGRNKEVIWKTAEKLLINLNISQLKQFQVEALFAERKYDEVINVGKHLLNTSITRVKVIKCIVESYSQLNRDRDFIMAMNLLCNFGTTDTNVIAVIKENNSLDSIHQQYNNYHSSQLLSKNIQYLCCFDNSYLNRYCQHQMQAFKEEERIFFNKLQKSISSELKFYDMIIKYEKKKSWNQLLKRREQCFWLQSDFNEQEQLKKKERQSVDELRNWQYSQQASKIKAQQERNEDSFDGNLSADEQTGQNQELPPCSKRINNINALQGGVKRQKKQALKIMCSLNFQMLFVQLAGDIKLQRALDKWQTRLSQNDNFNTLPATKKQLVGLIFFKKGMLHKKMLRYKKCEQALKMSKKLIHNKHAALVVNYQLIMLYVDTNNIKGVEFYLVHLVKIMVDHGIKYFDVVPEWSRPIFKFIIATQGIQFLNNISGILKQTITLYLKSDHTAQQLESMKQNTK